MSTQAFARYLNWPHQYLEIWTISKSSNRYSYNAEDHFPWLCARKALCSYIQLKRQLYEATTGTGATYFGDGCFNNARMPFQVELIFKTSPSCAAYTQSNQLKGHLHLPVYLQPKFNFIKILGTCLISPSFINLCLYIYAYRPTASSDKHNRPYGLLRAVPNVLQLRPRLLLYEMGGNVLLSLSWWGAKIVLDNATLGSVCRVRRKHLRQWDKLAKLGLVGAVIRP